MTKEQTDFLYSIAEDLGTTGIEYYSCKDGDKMRKIINSLEQQPSEDCVSRAEVIDELNRLGRNAFKDDTDYDNFFTFVDSLPPVTPTHGTCKDCVKGHKYKDIAECFCDYLQDDVDTDFYCVDFEKRGNEK